MTSLGRNVFVDERPYTFASPLPTELEHQRIKLRTILQMGLSADYVVCEEVTKKNIFNLLRCGSG